MKRLELEELQPTEPYVVPRKDYEADCERGFTVLEYSPAHVEVRTNPRNPRQKLETNVPAVHLFRCMWCQFDVVDSAYNPDPKTQRPRNGLDLIRKHLQDGRHPWPYSAFETPYGNVRDVKIEGVEDYTQEIQ